MCEVTQKISPGTGVALTQLLFPASFGTSAAVVCQVRDKKHMSAVLAVLRKLGPLTDLFPHVARVDKVCGAVRVAVCMLDRLGELNGVLQAKYQSQFSETGPDSADELLRSGAHVGYSTIRVPASALALVLQDEEFASDFSVGGEFEAHDQWNYLDSTCKTQLREKRAAMRRLEKALESLEISPDALLRSQYLLKGDKLEFQLKYDAPQTELPSELRLNTVHEHPIVRLIQHYINQTKDDQYLLTGLTLVTYTEPCAMCAMACIHARISNLVFAELIESNSGSFIGSLAALNSEFGVFRLRYQKE